MSGTGYKEKDVQKWLEALVNEGDLYPHITGRDKAAQIVEKYEDPFRIPEFSIDYLTRLGVARVAADALRHMAPLELVSADKSVSGTTGEALRPDIVAYNLDTGGLVLFELKKAGQTAREAMTELLAYEHELQNHFPFLSSHDVVFVLVSPEWPTLVDHSLASLATWGRRKILALDLQGEKDEWTLGVRIPEPWQLLGSTGIPAKGLSTARLVLNPKTPSEEADGGESSEESHFTPDEVRMIMSSLDLMKADGDRSGSHGFALLWKDHDPLSQAGASITVGTLNPYAFTPLAFEDHRDFRSNRLLDFWQEKAEDFEAGVHPPSMFRVTDRAIRFIGDRLSPTYDEYQSWEEEYIQLRQRATPMKFVYWGALGEFVEEFVTRFAVREIYAPHLSSGYDWSHPIVGLPLLRDLTGKRIIPDGELTPSVCFEIARTLGTFIAVTDVLIRRKDDENPTQLHILHDWLDLELLQVASEVGWMWYSYSGDIEGPPPPLTLGHAAPLKKQLEAATSYMNWIANKLLGSRAPVFKSLFVATVAAPLFEPAFVSLMADELRGSLADKFVERVGPLIFATVTEVRSRIEKGNGDPEVVQVFDEIIEAVGATDKTPEALLAAMSDRPDRVLALWEDRFLSLSDRVIDPPVYIPNPSLTDGVDWNWLRTEIDRMREAGHRYPAVMLAADGGYRSCIIESKTGDVDDPSTQVLFVVSYGGVRTTSKASWDDVMDGTAYENVRLLRVPTSPDDDPEPA